ncbi:hypothetical protein CRE_31207 [Caenorhabditis remanei]|uniref:NadR/Ttd14 AAA domain-containing protein n=1 Tax=Caenorhabditis remanei TaxID=31234 RepID=E3MLK8_CAERE|nr:hypothetical protein CRE_31207 [Caenorhabditis remanei]
MASTLAQPPLEEEVQSILQSIPLLLFKFRIYKLVLTGAPCSGKTTALVCLSSEDIYHNIIFFQVKLASFFRNLGWLVYTVAEAATVILGVAVKFSNLGKDQVYGFQQDLLATMLQMERTYFRLADSFKNKTNVLIICDRGAMDPSAYCSADNWINMLDELQLNQVDLLSSRYDQVVHLVTAAIGAEEHYTLENNEARNENLQHAVDLDRKTRSCWIGHPNFSIIDNNVASFDEKVNKLIQIVCDRIGIPSQNVAEGSMKRKWLVENVDWNNFGVFEEFQIEHFYLVSTDAKIQQRVRRRTQNGHSTFTLTSREYQKTSVDYTETRKNMNKEEFNTLLKMKDNARSSIFKNRRCFIHGSLYFKMDAYSDPLPPKANGIPLVFLETLTTVPRGTKIAEELMPPFLEIRKEITGDPQYSMHSLSEYPEE